MVGTEAAVQNQGSHRLTEKHRGQGLRNRESCDATVLTLRNKRCLADRERDMEGEMKKERERGFSQFRGIPVKVVSHPCLGLQRPLCVTIHQAAPSSHSGAPLHGARTRFPLRPRGSLKAYKRHLQKQSHYQVDIESCHHNFKVTIVCETEFLCDL